MLSRKTFALTLFLLLPLTAGSAHADPYDGDPNFRSSTVSLGIAVGDPSALDLKIWTGAGSGFDFGVGFRSFSDRIGFYGEYELGLALFRIGESVWSVFYLGLGGAISLKDNNDDLSAALIIPVGFNFRFRAPLEIFIEARPGFELLRKTGFGIGGQAGVRFVF